MPCRDHSLLTKRSAPPSPQVLPHLPLSKPCPASLLSLPWLHNTRWSKNRSSSHQKTCHASRLERATEDFCAWRAPSPPQAPQRFPPGRAGSAGAKVGTQPRQRNAPLILGFCKNFPAGNKPRQSIALQRGDSPDELIPGAVRILGPDPRWCAGYGYTYCLGLAAAVAWQGTGSSAAVPSEGSAASAPGAQAEQLSVPKGRKEIRAASSHQPGLPVCAEATPAWNPAAWRQREISFLSSLPVLSQLPRGLASGVREQPGLHFEAGSRAAMQACVVQIRAQRLGFTRRGANQFPGK